MRSRGFGRSVCRCGLTELLFCFGWPRVVCCGAIFLGGCYWCGQVGVGCFRARGGEGRRVGLDGRVVLLVLGV